MAAPQWPLNHSQKVTIKLTPIWHMPEVSRAIQNHAPTTATKPICLHTLNGTALLLFSLF